MLRDNVGPNGELNTNRFLRAMLQYRNTPQPDTRLSPAQVVFGRCLRDFIPVLVDKYEPKQEWGLVREYREKALARRLERDGARLEKYTKQLKPIPIGGAVAVQNQSGQFPKKWGKSGVVVDNLDYDKVVVRLDGSRRLTTRNRRFVKQIITPPDMPVSEQHQDQHEEDEHAGLGQEKEILVPQHDVAVDDGQHVYEGADGGRVQVVPTGGSDAENAGDSGLDMEDSVGAAIVEPPEVYSRPKRESKPNVRYNSEEYDLSISSVGCLGQMSGLSHRNSGGREYVGRSVQGWRL